MLVLLYIGLGLRQKPMTSFFYDVIPLRSVHGRSKTPKKAPFDGFWEISPLNVLTHLPDPQKAYPCEKSRVSRHFPSKSIHGSHQ